jgi:hypothetical protein
MDYQTNAKIATRTVVVVTGMTQNRHAVVTLKQGARYAPHFQNKEIAGKIQKVSRFTLGSRQ